MKPYWTNEQHGLAIYLGDCLDVLAALPGGIAQTCVTSPPYWGLRDYGVEGQLGLERTPEEYVARMVEVFRGVRRVLREDGTVWGNWGDSYSGAGYSNHHNAFGGNAERVPAQVGSRGNGAPPGLKPKDLVGIPWRVAFALQADGWWLRSDIIWAKANPMPESVTDRPTSSHEHVFLLAAAQRYWYDAHAAREGVTGNAHARGNGVNPKCVEPGLGIKQNTGFSAAVNDLVSSRNLRNVWQVNTQPFPGSHFAVFPEALVRPCIRAGSAARACSECGKPWERVVERTAMVIERSGNHPPELRTRTSGQMVSPPKSQTLGFRPACDCDADPIPSIVLDPFLGAGTTLLVAYQEGRRGIGIELNEQYAEMAAKRLEREMAQGRLFEPEETAPKPVQTTLEVDA